MTSLLRIGFGIALLLALAPATFAQTTCPGSDSIILDCNGNGTDDYCDIGLFLTSADANTNGIPDECDTEECAALWSGFETAPPFAVGSFIHGVDFNADGDAWDNPSNSWTVGNQGCPFPQGKALKGVSRAPPVADFVESELFTTEAGGLLGCGAHRYSLNFDLRSEASLAPRIDWQLIIKDGQADANVILIHLASTRSSFAGVTSAQGGNGRGRILVQNPAGNPTFINTGVLVPGNACFNIEVRLDNNAPVASAVTLFINGVPEGTFARLQPETARMDSIRIEQEVNGAGPPDSLNRLGLDNVTLCREGLPLDWPDCNANCVSDLEDVSGGGSEDCNANSTPDECESAADCNANGVQDLCDIAAGTSQDCDANGVPNECDPDCNANGVADGCDIAAGTSRDCNTNGRLDACDSPPDFNADGLVHMQDWAGFVAEFGGPGVPAPCTFFDRDADGDVDLFDASALQSLYTGADTDGDRVPDLYESDDGVYLSPTDTGTNPADPDTDRDGLRDGDELFGTLDGLDLPVLGASPFRKDIFIEVDWTDDSFDIGPHSHRPSAGAVAAITGSFAAAPVPNPYGGPNGISMHVDYGQGGPFTRGNFIPGSPPFIVFGGQFNSLKAVHFPPNRKGYFHYAIFTHRYNNSTNNSSGFAELPGDDFMVTLPFSPQNVSDVSKLIMHELGHNINLHHGGDEALNEKPNYNSVMNYRYTFPGVDADCDASGDGVLDYSHGLLASLDESHLNECAGICGPGFPLDWDFSGGPCQTDIAWNITEGEDGDDILSVLHDHDDWSAIVFTTLQGGDRAAPEVIFCHELVNSER